MTRSPEGSTGSEISETHIVQLRRKSGASKRSSRHATSIRFEIMTHDRSPPEKRQPMEDPSSPKFMFIPMSTEPGARAKIQAKHRASAKAHVMHDYQRKNAHQRMAVWKMATPKTYPLAPKMTAMRDPYIDRQTSIEQATKVVPRRESRSQRKMVVSPHEVVSSDETGPSSQPTPSSSGSRSVGYSHFIHYAVPTVLLQPRGSALMDVFSVLPFTVSTWDEVLITRWLNYDRVPWCPVNGQSQWIPFVVQSEMLLHTNLYCWGMHFHGKLTGIESEVFMRENPRILEHKIQAIRLINEHLAAGFGATDEILAAVSIMINTNLQFHTRDEAARHMAGLEAIVHLRGGLHNLSSMGEVGILLQRMISWNDLFFVELFGGTLRFANLPRWEDAWQSVFAPVMDDPITHLEPLQARFAGNAALELTRLLREIQLVCDDVEARPLATLSTKDRTLRHDTLLRFERHLCLATRITTVVDDASANTSTNADAKADTDAMWRAVATTALMYVHHHIRAHALHLAQFPALVVQLRNELSLIRDDRVWHGTTTTPVPSQLYTWVLAVGAYASQLREDWIVRMLAEECRARGCTRWDMFLDTLRMGGPFVGKADEEKFEMVWEGALLFL